MAHRRERVEREPEEYRFERLPSGRSRFVAAHFSKLEKAVAAARAIEERGYPRDRISVFMSSETQRHYLETRPEFADVDDRSVVVDQTELEKERKTLEGAGAGGAIGAGLGAIGGAIAAAGTIVIPGLGLAVAGPVAAALAGAGAGAATGGLIGALVGAGMSEYQAKRFKELLKDGRLIVGAEASTEAERSDLEEQLTNHDGTLVRESEPSEA